MLRLLASCALTAVLAPTLRAQAPCFELNTGTDLLMQDDDLVQGLNLGFPFAFHGSTYTAICLDSNGLIYLGATTTALSDFSVDVNTLLSAPQPVITGLWGDFDASSPGGGHVFFRTVPASGPNPAYALITWAGVHEFGTTTPIEVQVRLDAQHRVAVTYGATAATGGATNTQVLIGASPGLGALPNLVSLATRPVLVSQNNFADLPATGPAGVQMAWSPTLPGYLIADVACTPNSFPQPANSTPVGKGCPAGNTLYEYFDFGTASDLSGRDFSFFPAGTGFVVLANVATPFFTGFTASLGAGDDSSHLVSLPFTFPHHLGSVTQIHVSSNGFLTLGANDPGALCCSGDPLALVFGETMIAGHWSDLNPSAGGGVFADLDAATGDFVVTWNAVPEFPSVGAHTFQIALNPGGAFVIRCLNVTGFGNAYLTGYSDAHGTTDPGAVDLSALTVAQLAASPAGALLQAAVPGSRPVLGGSFAVDAANISPSPQGNIVMMFVNFLEYSPGIPLDALGAPTCELYVGLDGNELTFLHLALGAPTITMNTPIPLLSALQGLTVLSQLASDDTAANSLGFKISNGLRWYLSAL